MKNSYYKNNFNYVLSLMPNSFLNIGIIGLVFGIIFLTILMNKEIYDIEKFNGYVEKDSCAVLIYTTPDYVQILVENLEFVIGGETFKYRIVEISELLINSNTSINYQEIHLKIDGEKCSEWYSNQVLEVKVLHSKERAIKKIYRKIVRE